MFKTDSQIQLEVLDELRLEPMVDSNHIGVEVRQGVATLSGHVDSYAEKWHAEEAAQRVSSVKALAVELQVIFKDDFNQTDSDIAKNVKNIIDWNVFLPSTGISVMVEHGWVSLKGHVVADYQRRLAESSIRYLSGVKGVSNQLILMPIVSESVLKQDIEKKLQRQATYDAKKILIDINGHDVTLSGNVSSLAERDLISKVAWDSPGVWKVKNNIRVNV